MRAAYPKDAVTQKLLGGRHPDIVGVGGTQDQTVKDVALSICQNKFGLGAATVDAEIERGGGRLTHQLVEGKCQCARQVGQHRCWGQTLAAFPFTDRFFRVAQPLCQLQLRDVQFLTPFFDVGGQISGNILHIRLLCVVFNSIIHKYRYDFNLFFAAQKIKLHKS